MEKDIETLKKVVKELEHEVKTLKGSITLLIEKINKKEAWLPLFLLKY